jgi:hypothetical protein
MLPIEQCRFVPVRVVVNRRVTQVTSKSPQNRPGSRNASRSVAAVTPALIADITAISAFHSEAEKLVLVMDNLNTHKLASLYVTLPPEQARRIAKRLEIHVHAQARIVVNRRRDRVERVESSVPEPVDRVDRRTAERGRIVGRDAERDSSDIRPC